MDKGMLFNAIVGSFVGYLRRKNTTGTKTMRVMKLTALIVLTTILQVAAKGVAQDKITFTGKDVPLEKVFTAIKKQTSYLFLYNDALLVNAKKVTLQVKNATLEDVLSECFKDQPFEYRINGRTIFIINRPEPEKKDQSGVSGVPPGDEVKGRITNAQGEPLSGANIVIKRTGKGTQANANGEFTLKNVDANEAITISFTGYSAQTIKLGSRRNLMLVMQVADNELDEMVVQGYGTTTRRLATGNIAKVTSSEIEKQPVINPLQALQGRVAGLDVIQTSGYGSAPFKVELRGRNTINSSFISDPLYIVDGVPLTVLEVSGNSGYSTGSVGFLQNGGLVGPANGQSPLFSINPLDIESIEVLKDADATAIYGSRAQNGVILITTKKGRSGKTKFNFRITKGINKVTRYWEMLNTQQYLEMRNEAFKNDGITPTQGNAYDLLVWDTTRYTDWQKVLWGGTGKNTDIQLSLSGGDARTNFRISGGYNHATNITAVSGGDKRGTVTFNLMHKSINQKLSIAFVGGYSFTQSDMVDISGSARLAPNAPSIYDSSGKLNWAGWAPIRNQFPFSNLLRPYNAKTNFINSNIALNYELAKGLVARASFGYNNAQSNQTNFFPIAAQDPINNPLGTSQFGNNSNRNWIIEPQVEYTTFIGKGKFDVLVGASAQETKTQGMYVAGSGYTNDALLRTISNAPIKTASDNYGQYKYASLFSRVNYNWANKYILNLSARRDGSSNFGKGNNYGTFASVGAAWNFSEERWFSKINRIVSFGKLRASYGTTGGEGPPYAYLTRWSSAGLLPYSGIQPLIPTQHANPDYRWQINKKLEGAIDIGLFKQRVNISVAYYRNRCGNQLLVAPMPDLSGFTTVVTNLPAEVQNAGWEFTLGGKVINSKYFNWSPSFTFSINRNKLISFPNLETSPYKNLVVMGNTINVTKLLHFTGVDPQTGLYNFEDKDNDSIINSSANLNNNDLFNYKLTPKFTTGFGSQWGYKGFNLSLFFVLKIQKGYNIISSAQGVNPPGSISNQPVEVMERWRKAGDEKSIAGFTTQLTQLNYDYIKSDAGLTDASYLRLQNLSLAYNLPESISKKVGISECSIYFNTNNVFTITKYKGIDPETQNFGSLPPTRTYVGGISFTF